MYDHILYSKYIYGRQQVDLDCSNTDEEGYAYATDFGGGDDSYWGVKGRTSFVRRRRLNR
jgi:hypothetical protein